MAGTGKNVGSYPAGDFEVGMMMEGAGSQWKVGIDAITFRHYWVPAGTKFGRDPSIGTKVHFDALVGLTGKVESAYQRKGSAAERAQYFAIPSKMKNRHLWLPRRKRRKDVPMPIPEMRTFVAPTDRKSVACLKNDSKAYQCQRQKYLEAKKTYEAAKEDMERFMNIIPLSELQKLQHDLDVSKAKIQAALQKEQTLKTTIHSTSLRLQNTRRLEQLTRAQIEEARSTKDGMGCNQYIAELKNLNAQMCQQKQHLEQLQKQQRAIAMARSQLERLYQQSAKVYQKFRATRTEYKGAEDLAAAEKALEEAKTQVRFFKRRLEKIKAAIDKCQAIVDTYQKEQSLTGGALGERDLTDGDTDLMIAEIHSIDRRFETEKNHERYVIAKGSLQALQREQQEVNHQLQEAEAECQKAQRALIHLQQFVGHGKSKTEFDKRKQKFATHQPRDFNCRGWINRAQQWIGWDKTPFIPNQLVELGERDTNGVLKDGFALIGENLTFFKKDGELDRLIVGPRYNDLPDGYCVSWAPTDLKLDPKFSLRQLEDFAQKLVREKGLAGKFTAGSFDNSGNSVVRANAENSFNAKYFDLQRLDRRTVKPETLFLLSALIWMQHKSLTQLFMLFTDEQREEKFDYGGSPTTAKYHHDLLKLYQCVFETLGRKAPEKVNRIRQAGRALGVAGTAAATAAAIGAMFSTTSQSTPTTINVPPIGNRTSTSVQPNPASNGRPSQTLTPSTTPQQPIQPTRQQPALTPQLQIDTPIPSESTDAIENDVQNAQLPPESTTAIENVVQNAQLQINAPIPPESTTAIENAVQRLGINTVENINSVIGSTIDRMGQKLLLDSGADGNNINSFTASLKNRVFDAIAKASASTPARSLKKLLWNSLNFAKEVIIEGMNETNLASSDAQLLQQTWNGATVDSLNGSTPGLMIADFAYDFGGGQNTHTQFQQLMSDWQSFADRRVLSGGAKPTTARELAERYQTLLNQMDQVRGMLNTNLQQLVDNADKFDLKQMKQIAGGINNRRQKMKHKLGPMETFLRRDQRKIGDKKVTRLIQQRIDEIKRAL